MLAICCGITGNQNWISGWYSSRVILINVAFLFSCSFFFMVFVFLLVCSVCVLVAVLWFPCCRISEW